MSGIINTMSGILLCKYQ